MLEIAPNRFLVKSKIIEMKLANKDGKHWVVFNCGKTEKEEIAVFSAPHASDVQAKDFMLACAAQL